MAPPVDNVRKRDSKVSNLSAGRIALGYAAIAILWIAFSDEVVTRLKLPPAMMTIKGAVFVFVTASLLYFTIRQLVQAFQLTSRELDETTSYLDEAQRLSHTGSWAFDVSSGIYTYVSGEDYRIWGFDPHAGFQTGEAVLQRIHPEDRDRWKARFEKALREKADSSDEYRIVLPDGTLKHVYTVRHPVLNDVGDVVKLVGSTADITERKRAEEALALRSFALDNAHNAVLFVDEQARILYVNEECCRRRGYTREELLGMRVTDLDPDFPAERWPNHWQTLKTQRSLNFESRHCAKDGRIFPVEISAAYLEYAGRAFNLAVVRDITERKRAEEALRQSEAYLAEAQRLSHTGSWALDVASDTYVYISEEDYRIWVFDPHHGLPTREAVFQRIHPEDQNKWKANFERSLREKGR